MSGADVLQTVSEETLGTIRTEAVFAEVEAEFSLDQLPLHLRRHTVVVVGSGSSRCRGDDGTIYSSQHPPVHHHSGPAGAVGVGKHVGGNT